MQSTNTTFKTNKNKSVNKPVFLYTIENYDGSSNDLNLAEYPSDITFNSITYTAFPISHNFIAENVSGEIDKVEVSVANVNRLIQSYLESYDFRGLKVTIKLVWTDQLGDTDAYVDSIFYVDKYTVTEKSASFELSSKFDVLTLQLPARKFSRNYCQWKFKSTECGYSGAETGNNSQYKRGL